MEKKEFLEKLRQALIRQNTSEIDEIMSDFENHFNDGINDGKTAEEIAATLGDPEKIALQYPAGSQVNLVPKYIPSDQDDLDTQSEKTAAETYSYNVSQSNVPNYAHDSQQNSNGYTDTTSNQTYSQDSASNQAYTQAPNEIDSGRVVALVLINIFIAIPVVSTIIGILMGIWGSAFGVGVAAITLYTIALMQQGVEVQILVLFGISMTALTILLIIASYYLSKISVLGFIKYVRWNKSWAEGR